MRTVNRETRQWLGFWGMTLILAAALFFAWYLKTQVSDVAFQEGACRFSQSFHLYCPGCGGTRAVKHLLHFDLVRSFLSHPIPIYAGILLLRIWVALLHNALFCRQPSGTSPAPGSDQVLEESAGNKEATGKLGGTPGRWKLFYQWEMWTILVVVIGFFILRNVALVVFKWDYLGDMAAYW